MSNEKTTKQLLTTIHNRKCDLILKRKEFCEQMEYWMDRFKTEPSLTRARMLMTEMDKYADADTQYKVEIKRYKDVQDAETQGFTIGRKVYHKTEAGTILSLDGDRNGPLVKVKLEGLSSPQWYHPRELALVVRELTPKVSGEELQNRLDALRDVREAQA